MLNDWAVSFANATEYPNFAGNISNFKLQNINHIDGYEEFSGNMRYKTTISFETVPKVVNINLGRVGEVAELWINGKQVDTLISRPYAFNNIQDYFQAGDNLVEVVVTNNLGIHQKDYLSQFMLIKPAGLLGPVSLTHSK